MPTAMTPRLRFGAIGGIRIRYADSGGPHETLFAVDLPGFGIRLGRPRPGHWQLAMAQPKPGAVVGWL
jgi:hypothetical protein